MLLNNGYKLGVYVRVFEWISVSESVGVILNKGSIDSKKCFDEWSTMLIDKERESRSKWNIDHKQKYQ